MKPRVLLAVVTPLMLVGCATLPPGPRDPRDPWERYNRPAYRFNTAVDHAVLRPTARFYKRVTPAPVRASVTHFMVNAGYPGTIINEYLQGEVRNGTLDVARLVVNTIFGIGGLFDPASHMDLEQHSADFGQTLGKWGVHAGPYLILPFFAPSTVRDTVGLIPDEYTNVRAYLRDPYLRWGLYGLDKVNDRSLILDTDATIERTFDPYAFVRNAWLDHREYVIHGSSPDSAPLEDPEADAAAPSVSAPGVAAPPASAPK